MNFLLLLRTVCRVVLMALAASSAYARAPAVPIWWTTPVSIFDNEATDNWAMANVGHLKHVATQAKMHLTTKLNVTDAEWDAAYYPYGNPLRSFHAGANPENYALLNVGQLKFVASGFYKILSRKASDYDVRTRLQSFGVPMAMISDTGPCFPWSFSTETAENYSAVTIGQLKVVFSFDVNGHIFNHSDDIDADGMPDQWEQVTFGGTDQEATTDFDNDGLTNIQECYIGTNPKDVDSDDDRIVDAQDQWPLFFYTKLVDYIAAYVDSKIAGKTVEMIPACQPAFTVRNAATGEFQRNVGLWCSDIVQQLTCVSPESKAGTLISPRHVLFAAHHARAVGETIRFIAADNSIVSRVITAIRVHPRYNPGTAYPDITVALLDRDVPATISYALVLPRESWRNYIDQRNLNSANSIRLPVIQLDQGMRVSVADVGSIEALGADHQTESRYLPPVDTARHLFFRVKVAGDSGHPCFLVIKNQLALISVFTTIGSGTFVSATDIYTDINSLMAQLGGGPVTGGVYQLTSIDLSPFVFQVQ